MSEQDEEVIVFEGSKPYLVDPRRIIHPIPCVDIDTAEWWCEEFDTRVAEIRKKIEDGYYREDLEPMMVGDQAMNPAEDEEKSELYIANNLPGQEKDRTDFTKVKLYECYTTYEGAECVIILDLSRRTWVAAHGPFYQEFPRCYASFCWHETTGSIDGKSLCGLLDQLHRAYVAIVNILLDAGVRAIEPLVIALKELGLSEFFKDGRLSPGFYEAKKLVLEKLADGIHEIKLSTGEVMFLLTLLERIEKHMHDAGSIPPAFFGEEVADRPTATGTTAVMEKAMQPLYELMTRYRKFLVRVAEIMYSQYRQFNPESMRIFIEAQPPQEAEMMQAMLVEFPSGYWRDQVLIETKVNSQTMSKAIKKQEALAMVDKWPELSQAMLTFAQAAAEGGPVAPMAGNVLDVYDLVLKEWFTEFELPEVRDALDIQGSKMAGEAIAQAQQQLIGIIEEQQRKIVNYEAQITDLGGDIIEEPQGQGAGGEPGMGGPSQAAA